MRGPAIAIVALLTLGSVGLAAADSFIVSPARLPSSTYLGGAVVVGNVVYLAGGADGQGGNHNEIVRFDPATNAVSVVARLPLAVYAPAVVTDGSVVYVMGGGCSTPADSDCNHFQATAKIFRFDPATLAVTTEPYQLPVLRWWMSAAWANGAAYLVGGASLASGNVPEKGVYRFTPGVGVETLPIDLPNGLAEGGLFWSDGSLYHVAGIIPFDAGGFTSTTGSDRITRITPSNATAQTLSEVLPFTATYPGVAWDGQQALVVGLGRDSRPVAAYSPSTHGARLLSVLTPDPGVEKAPAVWVGPFAYVLGGVGGGGFLRSIDVFTPGTPSTPGALNATRALGAIRLSWTPAPRDTYWLSSATAIQVARSAKGPFTEYARVGPDATSATIDGLAPGEARFVRLVSSNAKGNGTPTAVVASAALNVSTPPLNVQIGPASAGSAPDSQRVEITWQPPADDGGAPILSYTVTSAHRAQLVWAHATEHVVGADACSAGVCSVTDDGCDVGDVCAYKVTATNLVGTSAPSAAGAQDLWLGASTARAGQRPDAVS